MMKQQEIDALRSFTQSLPDDSYLKPWLIEVESQVVQDIHSDFMVQPTIKATNEECVRIKLQAQSDAERIIADAHAKAKVIEDKADNNLRSILRSIWSAEKVLTS